MIKFKDLNLVIDNEDEKVIYNVKLSAGDKWQLVQQVINLGESPLETYKRRKGGRI